MMALLAVAGCTSDEFVGESNAPTDSRTGAISFASAVSALTRADRAGADAANDLGNQFIVYGEKNETTGDAPAAGNSVFVNYQVNWVDNSAYTTTSNTKGWEYVGATHSTAYQNNITTYNGSDPAVNALSGQQTIKFWDYGASSYTFTAVSAAGIEEGKYQITKNTSGSSVYDKGYTITVADGADLKKLFVSDRNVITKGSGADRDAVNAYGGNVTFRFRNVLSHVRVGIYETIPGYGISNMKFYVNNNEDPPTQTLEATAFGAVCPSVPEEGFTGSNPRTLTVTYENSGNAENQPIVANDASFKPNLILGTNFTALSPTSLLGTTATAPTWDQAGGAFTTFMPQAGNNQDMTLKCDFTLYNTVTKETIEVTGATATVPAQYLQWKPSYKYTYLFKISDDTNGSPGKGVVGLHPITFDALEVQSADGKQETITTVTSPSITTYSNGQLITSNDGYKSGHDIYIVVNNGTGNVALNVGTDAWLYTADNVFNEDNIEEAFANVPESGAGPWTHTYSKTGHVVEINAASGLSSFTEIPATDSPSQQDITINGAKFTPAANTTYVFRYKVADAVPAVDAGYTAVADGTTLTAGNYYFTSNTGAGGFTANGSEVADGTNYFELTTPGVAGKPAKYLYKVIKVE